jgi:predicted dehydrogenase
MKWENPFHAEPTLESEGRNSNMQETKASRRSFLQTMGLGAAALGLTRTVQAQEKTIPGFEQTAGGAETSKGWKPISDRKIRVGIAGYGVCKFGAEFGFQDHPNVEIVAISDLFPDRCAELAKKCRCAKSYPSAEELVRDDHVEAVFLATDAPSHARLCTEALKHGKHVASAVPAVWGSLEEADQLFDAVKRSGRKYMMFETSSFHEDLYAMRQIYDAGDFGKLVYSEGEYFHWMPEPIESYMDWRVGLPPLWYPTHANAYYVCVTRGSFTEVSCLGMPSLLPHLQPENNSYKNSFGTEIALFRTSEGGMSRMAVSWDTPGVGGEMGRVRGQQGVFYESAPSGPDGSWRLSGPVRGQQGTSGGFDGLHKTLPNLRRPPLPPGVIPGGHGGSHGYLMNEFVTSILEDRAPLVNIAMALNLTVAGIVAHQSALKGGEWMKIPQYKI